MRFGTSSALVLFGALERVGVKLPHDGGQEPPNEAEYAVQHQDDDQDAARADDPFARRYYYGKGQGSSVQSKTRKRHALPRGARCKNIVTIVGRTGEARSLPVDGLLLHARRAHFVTLSLPPRERTPAPASRNCNRCRLPQGIDCVCDFRGHFSAGHGGGKGESDALWTEDGGRPKVGPRPGGGERP